MEMAEKFLRKTGESIATWSTRETSWSGVQGPEGSRARGPWVVGHHCVVTSTWELATQEPWAPLYPILSCVNLFSFFYSSYWKAQLDPTYWAIFWGERYAWGIRPHISRAFLTDRLLNGNNKNKAGVKAGFSFTSLFQDHSFRSGSANRWNAQLILWLEKGYSFLCWAVLRKKSLTDYFKLDFSK